jgi:hypothetical protein
MVDSLQVRGPVDERADTIDYALGLFISDYPRRASRGTQRRDRGLPRRAAAIPGQRSRGGGALQRRERESGALRESARGLAPSGTRSRRVAAGAPSSPTRPTLESLTRQTSLPTRVPTTAPTPKPRSRCPSRTVRSRCSGGPRIGSRSVRCRPTRSRGSTTACGFTRDQSGRVTALHVAGGRAYDVVVSSGDDPLLIHQRSFSSGQSGRISSLPKTRHGML